MDASSVIFLLVGMAMAIACVQLAIFAIHSEICDKNPSSRHIFATVASIVILVVFYPTTIAPTGTLSNGGTLGFVSLALASILSWSAFIRNRRSPWLRRLLQLPVTALVTFMAVRDAACQIHAGGLLEF